MDWGKPVTPGTEEVEDFESALRESMDLRERTRE